MSFESLRIERCPVSPRWEDGKKVFWARHATPVQSSFDLAAEQIVRVTVT
jgi:hypothetical protein